MGMHKKRNVRGIYRPGKAAHNGLVAGSSPAGPTILINRQRP
jgi:hypothetical protein